MCLLTFLPAGIQPDVEALQIGADANPHGHGFAIVDGTRLIVRRGLRSNVLIDAFAEARHRHPHGPALFHARYATHGRRTVANCHPFAVDGDHRTVLAHNGILPARAQPARREQRSDTRIAAEDLLSPTALRLRRNRLALQRWMGDDNKIVILTVDRRFREQAYLLNEDAGVWHQDIWYSNTDFVADQPNGWRLVDDGWYPLADGDEPDMMRCPACGAWLDVTEPFCMVCGCCALCGDTPGLCLCFVPSGPRHR